MLQHFTSSRAGPIWIFYFWPFEYFELVIVPSIFRIDQQGDLYISWTTHLSYFLSRLLFEFDGASSSLTNPHIPEKVWNLLPFYIRQLYDKGLRYTHIVKVAMAWERNSLLGLTAAHDIELWALHDLLMFFVSTAMDTNSNVLCATDNDDDDEDYYDHHNDKGWQWWW